MAERGWKAGLEELASLIRRGEFAAAEAAAKALLERRQALAEWPPEDLSDLPLYVFAPVPAEAENRKLHKWVGSLNRLMRKLAEGDLREVARVAGIMKKYAAPYTPLLLAAETPARNLPGLVCPLGARKAGSG